MKIGIGGSAGTLPGIVEEAKAAEAAGMATYSISNIFGHDAIGGQTVVADGRLYPKSILDEAIARNS